MMLHNLRQDTFEMNVNDFVDSEWDYIVIYKNPTLTIYKRIIRYNKKNKKNHLTFWIIPK